MLEHLDVALHKARFLVVACLVIGNLFLLSLLPPVIEKNMSSRSTSSTSTNQPYNDANAVSASMSQLMDQTGRVLAVAGNTSGDILSAGGNAILQTGRFFGGVLHSCGKLIARGTVNTVGFIVHTPGNIMDSVFNTAAVSAVIKPSGQGQIPVIGVMPENTADSQTTIQKAPPITNNDAAAWPIHGAITTYFGVPHWPYQVTHTGIDISDGTRPGTTPVRPFKSGKVTQVIHSYSGLGNHVIIDHGDSVTAVYAHLDSTNVQEGQTVNKDTVVGMEGTTGASTGTHLHFEIMVNGQYVDPLAYIGGRP
jgi:hypothetical protein